MTKSELLDSNEQLLGLVSKLVTEEGMTSTEIFIWGLVATAITGLVIWGVNAVVKTIKLETRAMVESSKSGVDVLVKSHEMHIEELMEVKERQDLAGEERTKILIRMEKHDGKIRNHNQRIDKLEKKSE